MYESFTCIPCPHGLVTKAIVWSGMGARLVSQGWKKTTWQGEKSSAVINRHGKVKRGQQKEGWKYPRSKAKACWGSTTSHSVGQIGLLLLSPPSWIPSLLPLQIHWNQASAAPAELHLQPRYCCGEGKHRAVVLSSCGWKTRLCWLEPAVTWSVYFLRCLQGWAFAICGGACNFECPGIKQSSEIQAVGWFP